MVVVVVVVAVGSWSSGKGQATGRGCHCVTRELKVSIATFASQGLAEALGAGWTTEWVWLARLPEVGSDHGRLQREEGGSSALMSSGELLGGAVGAVMYTEGRRNGGGPVALCLVYYRGSVICLAAIAGCHYSRPMAVRLLT